MKNFISLLIICLATSVPLFGQQGKSVLFRSWMEKTDTDSETQIQIWCENKDSQNHSISYELLVKRQTPAGNLSTNRQGGQALIKPNEKKMLSVFSVNREEEDAFSAELKVFENGRQILSDSIKSEVRQEIENEDQPSYDENQVSGNMLIIDNTRTSAGHDFYELFYNAWEAPPGGESVVIDIEELPFRGLTTLIKIKLDEITVFSQHIQPQRRYLEELTPVAAQIVRLRVDMVLAMNKDLEDLDRKGSGIY